MKLVRRFLKNKKGIDTILAALLMVVIVVVASVMVYAWSTGLLGALLVTPSTGKEALNLEQTSFINATAVTLYIRNTGSASVNMVSYYVKDSSGNQYSRTSWTGPANIAPNTLATATITIGSTCGSSCTLAGTGFTFTAGSYTVTIITSRNGQFVFNAIK
jgi:hypothetical protein